jgi:hypothetical protein
LGFQRLALIPQRVNRFLPRLSPLNGIARPAEPGYAEHMEILPALAQGRLCLAFIDSSLGHSWLMEPLAILARRSPVRVIDGGNRFDAYRLARSLRWQGINPIPILEQVSISRAFTCHQVASSLAQDFSATAPVILLDFLGTFQDENVPLQERKRLFEACLAQLRRIADITPMLVTAKTGHKAFSEPLSRAADRVLRREMHPLPLQVPLFQEL